jgi:hypothetical protein
MAATFLRRIGESIWHVVTQRLLQTRDPESHDAVAVIDGANAQKHVPPKETRLSRATRVAHDQLIGLPKNAWALAWLLLHRLFENFKVLIHGGGSRLLAAAQMTIILLVLLLGGACLYVFTVGKWDDAKKDVAGLTCSMLGVFCPPTVLGQWSYWARGSDGSSWGGTMNIVQFEGSYQNAFRAIGVRNWKKAPDGKITCSNDSWYSDPSAYLDEDIIYHYDLKFKPIKGFVRIASQSSTKKTRFDGEYYESVAGRLEQGEIVISREPEKPCDSDVASSE